MSRNAGIQVLVGSFVLSLFLLLNSVNARTWTQNLSGVQVEPVPDWILPVSPEQSDGALASVSYEFLPSPGRSGLLISILFDEVEGGFLRAFWKAGDGAVTLSQNLYEGIRLPNRRHLLITQELLDRGGILTLQASGSRHHIHQIRWDWLKPLSLLSAEELEAGILGPGPDKALLPDDLVNGEAPSVPDDTWEKRIVTAQVTQRAERIEEGVEFPVELERAPSESRLEVKVNGLDLKSALVLWLNGQKAGLVYPEIPDLRDAGYQNQPDVGFVYRGWRKAAIHLPPALLQAGLNTLQFTLEESGAVENKPLAIKDLKLQLTFPPLTPTPPEDKPAQEELESAGVGEPQ